MSKGLLTGVEITQRQLIHHSLPQQGWPLVYILKLRGCCIDWRRFKGLQRVDPSVSAGLSLPGSSDGFCFFQTVGLVSILFLRCSSSPYPSFFLFLLFLFFSLFSFLFLFFFSSPPSVSSHAPSGGGGKTWKKEESDLKQKGVEHTGLTPDPFILLTNTKCPIWDPSSLTHLLRGPRSAAKGSSGQHTHPKLFTEC